MNNLQPKKKSNTLLGYSVAILVALCFVCMVMAWAVNLDTTPESPPQATPTDIRFENPEPIIPVAPVIPAYIVEYKMIGNGGSASITYQNGTGGTEQQDIIIPWRYPKFKAVSGTFLYISGQLNGTGTITCQIFLSGRLFKTSTSKGQYVIASCDGLVP
jgi:hypothetical protein